MVEVHDITGKLLYTDKEHDDTSELFCDGIDLRKADFRQWDLSCAFFNDCDLRDARFDDADLSDAVMYDCSLEGAYFANADLRYATLSGVSWEYERYLIDTEGAQLPEEEDDHRSHAIGG